MSAQSPPHDPEKQELEAEAEAEAEAAAGTEDSKTRNPNPTSDSDTQLQSQQSLTLDSQDPTILDPLNQQKQLINPDQQQEQQQQQQQQQQQEPQIVDDLEQDDPEAMAVSPTRHNPATPGNPPPISSRRASKRKKGAIKGYHRKQAAIEKKLQVLLQNFNPIPFFPGKSLDFSKHEELLRRFGLWDFAHIDFDGELRVDLVAQLIASYNSQQRGSYVNECKIKVSRADLARALKLPGKKPVDFGGEGLPDEFLSFIDEFVSNWMLLHEDTWMMPDEVLTWTRVFKEGHLEKVDWAGLMWFMVEKELAQGTQLVNCYYASHLQQLIKTQKEELFHENSLMHVGVKEDEDGTDVKMIECDESLCGPALDEQSTELSLAQSSVGNEGNVAAVQKLEKVSEFDCRKTFSDLGNVEKVVDSYNVEKIDDADDKENINNAESMQDVENDDNAEQEEIKSEKMMDFEGKGKEQGQWLLEGKINDGEHFLQRCTMPDVKSNNDIGRQEVQGEEGLEDDEAEEDEQLEGFNPMRKCSAFGGLSSENLMPGMEGLPMAYPSELCEESSLELLSRRGENSVMLGGPSMFSVTAKREIGREDDASHHAVNDNHKRMRIEGTWDHQKVDFDECLNQMQHWAGKARMAYEAVREDACQQANMTQQLLLSELGNKDHMLQQLKSKLDELQRRRQAEINRYDSELYFMSSLLDGYRRALTETQRAFAEYREKCPLLDEPIYKDAGDGGVVKSIMELEKERLKREEEERMMRVTFEELFRKVETEWTLKFEDHLANVDMWGSKLLNVEKEVKLIRDLFAKQKDPEHVSGE
ncbi:hypothetical protein Ancab_011090 [Ancistrocladus abbreviatus]